METSRWMIHYTYKGEARTLDMTWPGVDAPAERDAALRIREAFAEPMLVPDMSRRSDEDPTIVQLRMFGVEIQGISAAEEE